MTIKSSVVNKLKIKQIFLIVFVLFLAVCLFLGGLLFSQKKPAYIFGYSFFIINSSSMEPNYPVNSLIIVKKVPFDSLKAGDIIVFRSDALNGGFAFHRISRVEKEGLYTKGDNNNFEDNQLITEKTYIGKGVSYSYYVGRYIAEIRKPSGFIIFFVLPLAALYFICFCIKRLVLLWKS